VDKKLKMKEEYLTTRAHKGGISEWPIPKGRVSLLLSPLRAPFRLACGPVVNFFKFFQPTISLLSGYWSLYNSPVFLPLGALEPKVR
jgi:hypothetical protein